MGLLHQKVRGKLMWVWWVFGSKWLQSRCLGIGEASDFKLGGGCCTCQYFQPSKHLLRCYPGKHGACILPGSKVCLQPVMQTSLLLISKELNISKMNADISDIFWLNRGVAVAKGARVREGKKGVWLRKGSAQLGRWAIPTPMDKEFLHAKGLQGTARGPQLGILADWVHAIGHPGQGTGKIVEIMGKDH
eukprot:702771-Pelagomonas_calceolata.AAC.1